MSSSTARGRARSRKRCRTILTRIPASGSSGSRSARATCTARNIRARARCSTSSCRPPAGSTATSPSSLRTLYDRRRRSQSAGSATLKPRRLDASTCRPGPRTMTQTEEGTDKITDPATGELVRETAQVQQLPRLNPYVSASWALEHAPDRAIHLNGRCSRASPTTSPRATRSIRSAGPSATIACSRTMITGFRTRRRHHPAAGRRRDQAGRARHPPQARKFRRSSCSTGSATMSSAGSSRAPNARPARRSGG